MKKLTKLIFSCAAVAALAAAMGTAAMAANELTVTYADGSITVAGDSSEADQHTIVVLDKDSANVAEEDIKQIDQVEGKIETLKVGDLTDGTYYVRIGGSTGRFYTGKFTVGTVVTSDRILGDVNGDEKINVNDGAQIVNHALKTITLTGDDLQAADANDDGKVNVNDGAQIVNYALKNTSTIDGVKTIAEKQNVVAAE